MPTYLHPDLQPSVQPVFFANSGVCVLRRCLEAVALRSEWPFIIINNFFHCVLRVASSVLIYCSTFLSAFL